MLGLRGQPRDDLPGLVEAAGVGPAVRHREAVVQQHDVMRLGAAEHRAPAIAHQRLGHHQHHGRHGQHPQQQQQQLLEQDRLLMPLLADQQKLHGRPLDAAVPHQIDQVDQDRHADQRQPPPEQ